MRQNEQNKINGIAYEVVAVDGMCLDERANVYTFVFSNKERAISMMKTIKESDFDEPYGRRFGNFGSTEWKDDSFEYEDCNGRYFTIDVYEREFIL